MHEFPSAVVVVLPGNTVAVVSIWPFYFICRKAQRSPPNLNKHKISWIQRRFPAAITFNRYCDSKYDARVACSFEIIVLVDGVERGGLGCRARKRRTNEAVDAEEEARSQ